MSDDGSDFRRRLAERDDDSCKWTPRDALQHALDTLDDEAVAQLVIHYHERNPDGTISPRFVAAGLTYESHVAMLAVAQTKAIEEWIHDG